MRHIWLRDEIQENERRTPLTPQDAKTLIANGISVTVEKSSARIFSDEEYLQSGCVLVESGSWREAPIDTTILGLQELSRDGDHFPLQHRHIFFGYAFKQQAGWRELLSRFVEANGVLLDLEYLVDAQQRRVATFAPVAGHIGMAIGILVWCHNVSQQQQSGEGNGLMKRVRSKEQLAEIVIEQHVPLLEYIRRQLEKAVKIAGHSPVPVIIGGHGRAGSNAVAFAKKVGLQPVIYSRADTQRATEEGLPTLLQFDILVNAIKLNDGDTISPFLTKELLNRVDRDLSVIVDISCDCLKPNNPLPVYQSTTNFAQPTQRIIPGTNNVSSSSSSSSEQQQQEQHHQYPLDVVAITNLAALLPRESSIHFSTMLLPHLLNLHDPHYPIWVRAEQVFREKIKGVQALSSNAAPVLQLPSDYPRPISTTTTGEKNVFSITTQTAVVQLSIPSALFDNTLLLQQSQSSSSSLSSCNIVLLSIFQTLLHRLSAEEDFVVDILSSHNNNNSQLWNLRSNVLSTLPFHDLMAQNVQQITEIQKNSPSSFPSSDFIARLAQNGASAAQVLFVQHDSSLSSQQVAESLAHYDVALRVPETTSQGESIEIQLIYRSDLFSQERSQEFLHQFHHVLGQASQNAGQPLGSYSLVTEQAKLQLPNVQQALDTTWEGTVISYLTRNATQFPNKVVAIHGTDTMTYQELNELSAQLANSLIHQGLQLEDGVFVYGHRNLAMIWTILSSLRAGGAVSLMDPVYPVERIINCLQVARPKCWLSLEAAGEVPQEILDYLPTIGCTIVMTIPLPSQAISRGFLKEFPTTMQDLSIDQDHVAVVTFTSGSTGLPKAVLGRHGPLTHFYPWMKQRFSMSENDHFSMCSGISHDPLQRDIFTPIYLGATIHVPDADDILLPGRLARWMKSQQITFAHLTPAMGQLLSEVIDDTRVESLRVALFVGDKLTRRDVTRLRRVAPNVMAVNMYGSTETQRSVSYYVVPPTEILEHMKEILPVGKGMMDIQLVILNPAGLQCGVGELGEVYMRSPHLAKGYKGLIEQTREKFIQNPFRTDDPRDILYRTGDLGRYLVDGTGDIVGRADNQIKIRGFRIELGEINTMLSHHPSVRENVPTVQELTPGDKRIVCYVVPHTGHLVPAGHELRRFLEKKLPNYMVPSVFVVLKSIPLTPNGKINFAALPVPERMATTRLDRVEPNFSNTISLSESSSIFADLWTEMFPDVKFQSGSDSPRTVFTTTSQQKIAAIWSELLGISDFGPEDNFFDLGGQSLMATRLMSRLKQLFGVDITLEALFKNPTVSGLSATMEQQNSTTGSTGDSSSSLDLHKEAVLDPSIQISTTAAAAVSSSSSAPQDILLTGATGFVGSFLLQELLAQTTATIHCLVRDTTLENAKQRLSLQHPDNQEYAERVVPVLGDIASPLLGLSEESFQSLANKIDCVIHNAAFVHWLLPYERLKPANVNGTSEILRFAATGRVKPVHYMSTTGVFDSNDHYLTFPVLSEDATLATTHYPRTGGYEQSKWVAEQLVLQARERGIPTTIYRPSYISGDETKGTWTTDDFLCRLIKGCIQLGVYPDLPDNRFDITSVNYVSQSVVSAVKQGESAHNQILHLTNESRFPFNQFFESAQQFGFLIEKVSYPLWRAKLSAAESNSLHPVLSIFTPTYDQAVQKPRFERENAKKAVSRQPSEITPLLERYFSYFVRSGFLEAPMNRDTEFFQKYVVNQETADLVTRGNRS